MIEILAEKPQLMQHHNVFHQIMANISQVHDVGGHFIHRLRNHQRGLPLSPLPSVLNEVMIGLDKLPQLRQPPADVDLFCMMRDGVQ